ncbi:cysteine desulfurase-like protein [Vibrio rumoiensis]|uniref:Cysteine desulfurase-like protein n=1 Tax=Vibrio rumoiensis 1S-45 TaxID=1188252 RepID=A0A1E5E2W7_9VIBR|nr:cysteine desulfurase-like protein [Vibrio rumoiensis]OEF25914.1 cysteine desulfurase-like protein [Vibrio rumoiensis 1S-45]
MFRTDFPINAVRQTFPALQQTHNDKPVVFLDGPGGSQIPDVVLQSMLAYLSHYNANLGGAFFSSQITTNTMNEARYYGASLINAEQPENIVFGANMTSLTFHMSRTIARRWQSGDEIIVTNLDHYANVSSWQQAAQDKGVLVHQIDVCLPECDLDYEHLASVVNEKTKLIAVTMASNTTGTIVDIKRVVALAKSVGAMVYVDAVHYAPHYLIDVQDLGCDFLVCSAYKFFGPHIGLMYIAPKWLKALNPYKVEPATDIGPGRYETGTQSFEALAGLIACVEHLGSLGDKKQPLRQRLERSYEQYQRYEHQLTEYFLEKLQRFPQVRLYGHSNLQSGRTPTFALKVSGKNALEIAQTLATNNICVWSGHFYAKGLVEQLRCENEGGLLRVGLMHYNTVDEIDAFFEHFEQCLNSAS